MTCFTYEIITGGSEALEQYHMINLIQYVTLYKHINLDAAVTVDECSKTIDASYCRYILCYGQIVTIISKDPPIIQY